MSTVGFVGLGAMGSRIAGRLLDPDNTLYATNRTKSKAEPLIERGLQWRASPREVAEAADVVFSMVTDDAALEAITSGPDGILAGPREGKVYVDMSTVSPRASRQLAERVDSLGAQMLDAPVSGSIPQAETGTLAIFVGGSESAFARAEPLLHELGQAVTRVGTNGQGLLIKLAINIRSSRIQPRGEDLGVDAEAGQVAHCGVDSDTLDASPVAPRAPRAARENWSFIWRLDQNAVAKTSGTRRCTVMTWPTVKRATAPSSCSSTASRPTRRPGSG